MACTGIALNPPAAGEARHGGERETLSVEDVDLADLLAAIFQDEPNSQLVSAFFQLEKPLKFFSFFSFRKPDAPVPDGEGEKNTEESSDSESSFSD